MPALTGLPWPMIHDFLAEVGSERTVQDFKLTVMKKINDLIPYDVAAMWFEMGKSCPRNLCDGIGVSQTWMTAHNKYYYRLAPTFPNLASTKVAFTDWPSMPNTEYRQDFIQPQGIRHGGGFILNDNRGIPSLCLCLTDSKYNYQQHDRTRSLMDVIRLHLENYYRILTLIPNLNRSSFFAPELAVDCKLLSKREAEIAGLLCRRLNASEIGSLLLISPQTVYRHIANIYTKLKVRNRRQLLLKLRGEKSEL